MRFDVAVRDAVKGADHEGSRKPFKDMDAGKEVPGTDDKYREPDIHAAESGGRQ